jgi:hypothetical protein
MPSPYWSVEAQGLTGRTKALCAVAVVLLMAGSFCAGRWLGRVAPGSTGTPTEKTTQITATPTSGISASGTPTNVIQTPKKHVYPPGYNHALYTHGATITGGANSVVLIDGISKGYDWYQGYGYSCWTNNPPDSFLITLKEPVTVDCVRLLLWDGDERVQRYKIEVSENEQDQAWTMVADHTAPTEACRGWQVNRFESRTVKRVRLTSTFNSANPSFYVVEVQVSQGLPTDDQTGFEKVPGEF